MACILITAEIAIRLIFRETTTTADNRSYFALRWKSANVRLNSLGFRDREPEIHKSAETYRIAFIGDSFAFGQGIPESSRMSNLLERELRARGIKAEVLNFGNPGNNTAAEVRVLRLVLERYQPDFIVLQWYVNDVENNSVLPIDKHLANRKRSLLVATKQWLLNKSALYFLGARAWHNLLAASGRGYLDELHNLVRDPSSRDSILAEQSLHEFIGLAQVRGIPCGLVLVPDMALIDESGYAFTYLHDRVMRLCERTTTPCLDLAPAFQDVLRKGVTRDKLWVNQFDSHMGIDANAIATTELLQRFAPFWIKDAALSVNLHD